MAWNTGEACGLTLTRSSAFRCANHSAVIAVTREALEAWWPPTLTPSPVLRPWLAASTMRTASHSTRRWISASTSRSTAVLAVTADPARRSSSATLHPHGDHRTALRVSPASPRRDRARRPRPAAVPPFRRTGRDVAVPAGGPSCADHPSPAGRRTRSRTGSRRSSRSSRSKTPTRSCPATRRNRSRRTSRPTRSTGSTRPTRWTGSTRCSRWTGSSRSSRSREGRYPRHPDLVSRRLPWSHSGTGAAAGGG